VQICDIAYRLHIFSSDIISNLWDTLKFYFTRFTPVGC
jgi:hypothetical protein